LELLLPEDCHLIFTIHDHEESLCQKATAQILFLPGEWTDLRFSLLGIFFWREGFEAAFGAEGVDLSAGMLERLGLMQVSRESALPVWPFAPLSIKIQRPHKISQICELENFGFTNMVFDTERNFMNFATTRGVFHTWAHLGTRRSICETRNGQLS
jgi:hypothetical protein